VKQLHENNGERCCEREEAEKEVKEERWIYEWSKQRLSSDFHNVTARDVFIDKKSLRLLKNCGVNITAYESGNDYDNKDEE